MTLPPRTIAAFAGKIVGKLAGAKLRPDGAGAKLRMGEVKIVLPFGHVVRILVAEREADPPWPAVRRDHIEAGDLRLLAAVEGEFGEGQVAAGRHQLLAIALVEPLGLNPGTAVLRFSARKTEIEHPDRVGLVARGGGRLAVHLVAGGSAPEMGEAGSRDDAVGGIGMIERRADRSLDQKRVVA